MKTILVIDDDKSVLSLFGLALRQHGYRVITANAGDEGLALARQHFPDLILCDFNMPGTDGRNVLQALRSDPELAAKQFVLITGNTTDITPRSGMEWGADDFLVKPFTVEALLRCVEARLKRADVHWRVEDRMLRDLRTGLHSTLPHEFFTPLAGILGLVEVLRGDITQLKPAEVSEILDDIERSGLRLHRALKNYLLILELDSSGPFSSRPLELTASQAENFIRGAVENAIKRHERFEDLSIKITTSMASRLPPDLATMAEELVENACSFSRKGTPVSVELGANRLIATDRGRGMTVEEIQQIRAFRQFDRKKYEQQGLGLGLVVVQKLAARNHCRLELQSEPGKGTTAAIVFEN